MIKLLGAICIVIGGFFLGLSIEKKYKDKIEFWKEIQDFLIFCQSEINYTGATIEEICEKEREKGKKYSVMIADAIQYNTTNEDLKLISNLSDDIKTIDRSTQQNVFSFYREEVDKKEQEAETVYRKNGKTYRNLLPLLCAGIVVLVW